MARSEGAAALRAALRGRGVGLVAHDLRLGELAFQLGVNAVADPDFDDARLDLLGAGRLVDDDPDATFARLELGKRILRDRLALIVDRRRRSEAERGVRHATHAL